MSIMVNGQLQPTASNLDCLLEQLGYQNGVVATALNGRFVPITERKKTGLVDGDCVEIVAPMQGG